MAGETGPLAATMGLAYTQNMLFIHQAVIERDVATTDQYGADTPPDFQVLATVPCRLFWARGSGMRSQKELETPQRLAAVTSGGVMFPLGTDLNEADRIARILDSNGDLYIEGTFEVLAAAAQETHLEVSVVRPHLGA
jgi:hypothetical protein